MFFCHEHGITGCVFVDYSSEVYEVSQTQAVASNHNISNRRSTKMSSFWYKVIFVKQELVETALLVANEVFFFDVDVLLFGNPWKQVIQLEMFTVTDLYFQREHGWNNKCGAFKDEVNSGQMYIRNSSKLAQYFSYFASKKYESTVLMVHNDQEYIPDAVSVANLTACGLPAVKFSSYCHVCSTLSTDFLSVGEVVSYHLNCAGSTPKRVLLMSQIIGAAEANPNNTKLSSFCS